MYDYSTRGTQCTLFSDGFINRQGPSQGQYKDLLRAKSGPGKSHTGTMGGFRNLKCVRNFSKTNLIKKDCA